MNIYIQLEIKVRDLEGRLLLALEAASRGHEVLLGPISDLKMLVRYGGLRPGIFHTKSLTPIERNLDRYQELRRREFVLSSQDEESGLLFESYDSFAQKRFSDASLESANFAFCWGAHDRSSLHRTFERHAGKIISTGNPRVDLWRRDMNRFYGHRSSYLPKSDYVLVSSNLTLANSIERSWNILARQRGTYYPVDDEAFETRRFERHAYQERLFARFVAAVRRISKAHPTKTVVVRPHPIEDIGAWDSMVGSLPNVRVSREGGISEWVREAKAVIHNACTTAYEATVCGTPVISFRPLPSEFDNYVPNRLGALASTGEELEERVADAFAGKSYNELTSAETRGLIYDRFDALEGPLAVERIVDHWQTIDGPELSRSNAWPVLVACVYANYGRVLYKRTSHRTADDGGRGALAANKFAPIGEDELRRLVLRSVNAIPRYSGLRVSRLSSRLVLVRPA